MNQHEWDEDWLADETRREASRRQERPARRGSALRLAMVWLFLCLAATLIAPKLVAGLGSLAPGRARPLLSARAVTQRPPNAADNQSVFRADGNGHFLLDAAVNGAPVRFLLDTGATYVVLSDEDAKAAGIERTTLTFDQQFKTANGVVRGALVRLRELRIGQMSQNDVAAVVLDAPEPVSLLGMSFLSRLDRYDIRDGTLTLFW